VVVGAGEGGDVYISKIIRKQKNNQKAKKNTKNKKKIPPIHRITAYWW